MSELKILVVDDFSTMRRVIKKILKQLDLTDIVEAANGIEAWDALQEHPIDVVICDWNMPEMNGLELLEKIRADAQYKELPFVMVTAEGKKESMEKAAEKGVTSYISKPFTAKDLEKKLKRMIDSW